MISFSNSSSTNLQNAAQFSLFQSTSVHILCKYLTNTNVGEKSDSMADGIY